MLRSGTLPNAGGAPVTILATTTIAELTAAAAEGARNGLATLAHGQTIPVTALLHLACEANIVPVVFDDAGGILAYGRSERCATPGQRRALAARDGGCTFPGCERPPAWCEAHHVKPWLPDGLTDLDNLALLCRHHHRSFKTWGWQVRMTRGRPEWLPPPWIDPHHGSTHNEDPERTPLINDPRSSSDNRRRSRNPTNVDLARPWGRSGTLRTSRTRGYAPGTSAGA